jgi:NAD(P)-dependent dehydrogenase (short-subunit alcohol dehydrogenase family)
VSTAENTQQSVVVVTGAAGGIGAATVRELLTRPTVRVLATDLRPESLQQLSDQLDAGDRLVTRAADVTATGAMDEVVADAVQRWGALHGIANIAGVTPPARTFVDTDDEQFDKILAVNARSAFAGTRAAIPHLIATKGSVVNIGSHFARRGGTSFATYIAAKHAVVGLSKAAAWEYAPDGVRVNVVAPGATYTDMVLEAFAAADPTDPEAGRRVMESKSPSGRLSYPAEIAATIVWLLLDAPGHLTGQVISVDGAKAS